MAGTRMMPRGELGRKTNQVRGPFGAAGKKMRQGGTITIDNLNSSWWKDHTDPREKRPEASVRTEESVEMRRFRFSPPRGIAAWGQGWRWEKVKQRRSARQVQNDKTRANGHEDRDGTGRAICVSGSWPMTRRIPPGADGIGWMSF